MTTPKAKLYLLGTPRLELDGAKAKTDTRKATALLAYLALGGRRQSREVLAALFWPESDDSRARAALRRTLSALKKALGNGWLEVDREAILLEQSKSFWMDVAEFQRLVELPHEHPELSLCPDCTRRLDRALKLYRGDFMAGFSLRDSPGFDEWQFFQAEELRKAYARALTAQALAKFDRGEVQAAIDLTRKRLALDPLNEAAHRDLMSMYARSGDRSASLQQYRQCVRVLESELGVPPLEETSELYESIRRGEVSPTVQPSQTIPLREPGVQIRLVGREGEWTALEAALASVDGEGVLALLEGEAGIGKTRFAQEFLQEKQSARVRVLAGSCYEGEMELAYAPVVQLLRSALQDEQFVAQLDTLDEIWLSEVARILPELREHLPSLAAPAQLAHEAAELRFFEGVKQTLAAYLGQSAPGILFLDDLQWVDAATLSLLGYIIRRLDGFAALVLLSYRTGSNGLSGSLRQQLGEFSRLAQVVSIRPSRFAKDDVRAMVRESELVEGEFPEEELERLYRHSEGLPYFLVEYLRAIAEGEQDPEKEAWEVPDSVRTLMSARLSSLAAAEIQLLSAAAVLGRSVDMNTLMEVSGRSDMEAADALDSLSAKGIVKEGEHAQYEFEHELMRKVVLEETGQLRLRLLHRRAAQALETRYLHTGEGKSLAGQVARHYQSGGEDGKAADFFLLAAEHAQSLFANGEARGFYQLAKALGHPDSGVIEEAIGDLSTLLGDYAEAVQSYERVAADAQGEQLGRIEHKIGQVRQRQGMHRQAASHYQAALEASPQQATVLVDWSLAALQSGDRAHAADLAARAMKLADSAQDELAQAQSGNVLGIISRKQGDVKSARTHLQASVSLSEKLGDDRAKLAALNNLALALADEGDLEQAIQTAVKSLEISKHLGDRHRQAAIHNNLADLHHQAGDEEASMRELKAAATLFSEIGVEERDYQPEIWKLVEW